MTKGTDQAVTRREHILDTESKRVSIVDPFGGVVTQGNYTEKKVITEDGSVTTVYQGKAQIGTATSSTGWQILKLTIDTTTGTVVNKTWAEGTDAFIHEMGEYLTYTYS